MLGRHPIRPYRLYLILECGMSFLLGISYATITVYWVISGRLNPLQLLLLGTALELSYFLLQLPTGVLADLVSRRLCTLAGLFIVGLALIMQGLSPSFASLLGAQVVLGLGAALNNGAQEAWVADELAGELGDERMTSVYLRATQFGLIATVAGSLLSGVIALAGLNAPLLTGGSLICLLALGSAVVMPESNFRPVRLPAQSPAAEPGATGQPGATGEPGATGQPAAAPVSVAGGGGPGGRPRDPPAVAGAAPAPDAVHSPGGSGGTGPRAAVRHDAVRRHVERELRPALGCLPAARYQIPPAGRPASGDVVQPVRLRRCRARTRRDGGSQAAHRTART